MADSEIEEQLQKSWAKSSLSYVELLELNVRFLQKKLIATPYHYGPTDLETEGLLQDLVSLHNYGILTFSSQPQMSVSDKPCNKHEQWQQRACLFFLIPKSRESKIFLSRLLQRPDLYAQFILPDNTSYNIHNFPVDEGIVLSRERSARCRERLDQKAWTMPETIHTDYKADWPDWGWRLGTNLALANPIEICVVARDWEKDIELLKLIKKEAIEAGIPRFKLSI